MGQSRLGARQRARDEGAAPVKRWFRFYEEAPNDDKVRCLPSDAMRWHWVVLLAVASKYGGEIPSLAVAAENLRLSKSKAAEVIATIAHAGLLDRIEGGYFRAHNWQGRQPTDATAAERKRRQRKKERDDIDMSRSCHAVTTVTGHEQVTPLEIRDKSKISDGGDARACATQPWELEPCHDLARRLSEIAKKSEEFEFTGWGGATYRVKTWLANGWPEELIVDAFREASGKPNYLPPNSIAYFEQIVARFIARATAPVPKIVEIPGKTVEVTRHEKPATSGLAAIDRIFGVESGPRVLAPADENSFFSLPARSVSGA